MICERCGAIFCDDYADDPPGVIAPPRRFCSNTCKAKAKVRRTKRRTVACRTPEKKRYDDEAVARSAAAYSWAYYGKALAPYSCRCGWWHLTSIVQQQERKAA